MNKWSVGMPNSKRRFNANGLTFTAWLAAAHRSEDRGKGAITLILLSAWDGDEDPAEWIPFA